MYVIHSKPGCPYCDKAIDLLKAHKIDYELHIYDTDEKIAAFKAQGYKTFPQIFNDEGKHIGGYTDLEQYFSDDDF